MRTALILLLAACATDPVDSGDPAPVSSLPTPGEVDRNLTVQTSLGAFGIALEIDAAPLTTANFLQYVDQGFYDGADGLGETVFHRVVPDFVVQGGGYTAAGALKETGAPIVNEAADSGLSNLRGTLAMARTNDPDSATSQFFVNLVDNTGLDPNADDPAGYAVFGEVTSGMDVVDAIAAVPLDGSEPVTAVLITSIARDAR